MADELPSFSEQGYRAPRARDFLDYIRDEYEARVDVSVDWGRDTVLGQLTAVMALRLGDIAQATQKLYDSRDINAAEGTHLDNLVALAGISRTEATRGQAIELLRGDVFTPIPSSKKVDGGGPNDRTQWTLTRDVDIGWTIEIDTVSVGESYEVTVDGSTVDYIAKSGDTAADIIEALDSALDTDPTASERLSTYVYAVQSDSPDRLAMEPDDSGFSVSATASGGGSVTLFSGQTYAVVECDELGRVEAQAGQIDSIATPVSGWASATNPAPAEPGRPREKDFELRERWLRSLQRAGNSSTNAIRAAVLDLEFIEAAVVVENGTDSTVTKRGITLPPSSFSVIVFPTNLTAEQKKGVARTIYKSAPCGIESIGSQTHSVVKRSGLTKDISYSFASTVSVDVDVTVTLKPSYQATDVEGEIAARVEDYFSREISVGDDVRRLPLYGEMDAIEGVVQVTNLDLNGTPTDIGIGAGEYAVLGSLNISV